MTNLLLQFMLYISEGGGGVGEFFNPGGFLAETGTNFHIRNDVN